MTTADLGPVRYEAPLTRSAPQRRQPKPLRTGPRFVRGRTRWHRVRSGTLHDHGEAWAMWCGQTRFGNDKPDTSDGLPTDGLPLCGTCEGRAAGAGHTSPLALPDDVGLLFRPARLVPPRWCPGEKYHHLHEQVGRRVLRCGACGELVPERNASYWSNHAGEPRRHEPGPGLVPGCEMHAWRHLVRTREGVACQCARIEEEQ